MKQRLTALLAAATLTSGLAMAKIYKGTVYGAEDGEPLIGASVAVKGQQIGVTTDIDGNFAIDIPDGAKYIIISYVGMEPMEIPVNRLKERGNEYSLRNPPMPLMKSW